MDKSIVHQQTGWNSVPRTELPDQISIGLWCLDRNITLQATHPAGVLNMTADKESKVMKERTDWKLCPEVFVQIN